MESVQQLFRRAELDFHRLSKGESPAASHPYGSPVAEVPVSLAGKPPPVDMRLKYRPVASGYAEFEASVLGGHLVSGGFYQDDTLRWEHEQKTEISLTREILVALGEVDVQDPDVAFRRTFDHIDGHRSLDLSVNGRSYGKPPYETFLVRSECILNRSARMGTKKVSQVVSDLQERAIEDLGELIGHRLERTSHL